MNSIECSSCSKQKFKLKSVKSSLFSEMTLYLCEDCHSKRMEPRYLIILIGRSEGPERIKDYIRKRRYVGEDILAREIV